MKLKIVETRKYSKLGSEQFRNDLQSMPFDEIKNITADPNEMCAMWTKFFLDVPNKHAPLTKFKGNNLSYTHICRIKGCGGAGCPPHQ